MSRVLDRAVTEAAFQAHVIHLAKLRGWRVAHFRAAQNGKGQWRTPVAADGAGFPDLILVRGTRIIAAELKSERGSVRPEQREWLNALEQTQVETFIWKPRHWPEIKAALAKEAA